MAESPENTGLDEPLLQALAELELVKRKAQLLEQRLTAWETRQAQALTTLEQLVGGAPAGESPEEKLKELEHRITRLERRRAAATPAASAEAPPPKVAKWVVEDLMAAVVRARWLPDTAERGDTVTLLATVAGVPAGQMLPVLIFAVANRTHIAQLEARSDGDVVEVKWSIPDDLEVSSVYFTVSADESVAESPVLYLAAR